MSEGTTSTPARRARDGFTLTEILVVVALAGIMSTALVAAFSIIVRTTPDSTQRVTDARSLKGLVTWLPQDVDATPPRGFDTSPTAWPCAGSPPPDSYNVIAMSWTEFGDLATEFHAAYRYEFTAGTWVVARYSCENTDEATRWSMTSELPPWDTSSPPAFVALCSLPIDAATGACPSGGGVTDPTTEPVKSMKITLTLLDGTPYTIDAAAKNPDENLADDPLAVTNYPPEAGVTNRTVTLVAGQSLVLDLYATHSITDAEGDVLTSAVDSYEPMPDGITATSSDPLRFTVASDPSLGPGPLPEPIHLIVSDAFGGSVEITVAVEIVLLPNDPPSVSTPTYTLAIGQGETIIVPLDLTHGVSDANHDPLSLEVPEWPAPLAKRPDSGAPLGELQMQVIAKPEAELGPVDDPIVTRIWDDRGGYAEITTSLVIEPPTANIPPTVTTTAIGAGVQAGSSTTVSVSASHGATDPNDDLMWVELDPFSEVPSGLAVTTNGLEVTIVAAPTMVEGPVGNVDLRIFDWHGASTTVAIAVEVTPPPPPPPSPCVLGSLVVSQNPVGRYGNGNGPKVLGQDVLVTLTYSGTCDGLVLSYDTGHPSGLGSGVGRVFPPGSPTSILLRGYYSGGTELWTRTDHLLTASTTSAVTPDTVSITLTVK